jgi:uncharacterized membrane protein
MAFYDAFFGSDQSLYTAYAIIAAIIAICITILLTATDVSVGNRILIVLFVIVTLVPSIFLTLFELTCIVTGGTEPNRWWCYAFAWVLAAFIIIYCIFIVIISLISLFTYNSAIDNINEEEERNKLTPETSNTVAKEIINNQEVKQKEIEKFYQVKNAHDPFENYRQPSIPQQFVDYTPEQQKQQQPKPEPPQQQPQQQSGLVYPNFNLASVTGAMLGASTFTPQSCDMFASANGVSAEGFEGIEPSSLSFSSIINGVADGIKSMVPANIQANF